jgi:hypothetical protein
VTGDNAKSVRDAVVAYLAAMMCPDDVSHPAADDDGMRAIASKLAADLGIDPDMTVGDLRRLLHAGAKWNTVVAHAIRRDLALAGHEVDGTPLTDNEWRTYAEALGIDPGSEAGAETGPERERPVIDWHTDIVAMLIRVNGLSEAEAEQLYDDVIRPAIDSHIPVHHSGFNSDQLLACECDGPHRPLNDECPLTPLPASEGES